MALVVLATLAASSPGGAAPPISSHAMVYACCTPRPLKERFFAEAKASGAQYIRVDFELTAIYTGSGSPQRPDWRSVDEVMELSRRYRLPVLGLILNPPAWLSACSKPEPDPSLCAVKDPAEFGRLTADLAAHARGTIDHWEILNEPDADWAFKGTPEDYARMLSAAHDAIKARVPEATIVSGGVERPDRLAWIRRVFATPGADAAHKFDISAVHLRLRLRNKLPEMAGWLTTWRELLARHGFTGPVWVTEHGYAADPHYQWDTAYRGGADAQAAFLRNSIPALVSAGAEQVFVTLRDNDYGGFLSEGVDHIDETPPSYAVTRRPSFAVVRDLASSWDRRQALGAERRQHEEIVQLYTRLAEQSRRAGNAVAGGMQEGAARGHALIADRLARKLG